VPVVADEQDPNAPDIPIGIDAADAPEMDESNTA
jgi:hypothetical protein